MKELLQQTTTVTTVPSSKTTTTTITQIVQNLGVTSKFYTLEL
jgi:hypothetical protein